MTYTIKQIVTIHVVRISFYSITDMKHEYLRHTINHVQANEYIIMHAQTN